MIGVVQEVERELEEQTCRACCLNQETDYQEYIQFQSLNLLQMDTLTS